jgi:uncharacterized protein YjbI with pentapeptide repeats
MRRSGVLLMGLAAAVGTMLMAGPAAALDEQDLQRLQQSGDCQDCDFSGGELAGARLTDSRLMGSNFEGADLRGAAFVGVDLSNADLRDVDLSGAVIQNTWLRGAQLGGAVFNGTVFAGADLTGARGLTQWQLNAACDEQGSNPSAVPIPLSLPPCR